MSNQGSSVKLARPEDISTVRRGIIRAIVVIIVVFPLGYMFTPTRGIQLNSVVERLVFTLQWQALSMLTLVYGIHGVGSRRAGTAAMDPITGNSEDVVKFEAKFLQNTIEQLILSIFGQLVLCTHLTDSTPRVIPVLVCLFVVGRVLFWIGYKKAPLERATGFAMTFFPSLIVNFVNVVFLVYNLTY
ncbi:transmembrane protein 79-like [Mya arenaria]|uniref:transmembrane protein 79-like n=1 Tax=Mya arenaria TaxID=6604 RepID=UPI0022E64E96|nr:transmembrane protein 79-like [Mya arenaria]